MHEILAERSAAHDLLSQRIPQLAQHAGGLRRRPTPRRRGEYLEQQLVGAGSARHSVARQLVLVVLAQGAHLVGDVLDARPIGYGRFRLADLGGEAVDVFELGECRPARVFPAPGRIGLEPHRERLGEVFRRMRLGIPRSQMLHEAAASRPRTVGVRIRQRRGTEDVAPVPPAPQAIRRIDGMPGLVPQDSHQPVAVAAFDLTHEAPFDAHQTPVRQVEWNRDSGDAVGGKPLLSQPTMRPETDTARREFPV